MHGGCPINFKYMLLHTKRMKIMISMWTYRLCEKKIEKLRSVCLKNKKGEVLMKLINLINFLHRKILVLETIQSPLTDPNVLFFENLFYWNFKV